MHHIMRFAHLFHTALTCASLISGAMAADPSKPNIVFILADDLGYGELGCYGQQKIRTPNIDRLAKEGLRFTQAYTSTPVCAPARCNLMTGKHAGHSEIRGNLQAKEKFPQFKEGQYPISSECITIAQVFQQAGYATGGYGKWGLGPVGSTGAPLKKGFDHFYGYNCQAVAHSYYPRSLWNDDKEVEINPRPIPGHAQKPQGEVKMEDYIGKQYSSELIIKEAVGFIRDNKDKPFFLYLPFIEPHVALHPPKELVEEYPKEWDSIPYRGENGYLPHPRPRAAYAALVTDLDRHVGAILETLKKYDLEDNTVVIFISDNGTTHPSKPGSQFNTGGVDSTFFNSLGGLKGFKGSLYEGGIRTPFIIRYPGKIKPDTKSDFPTYFPDQFPTLCEIAHITPPKDLDGISLLPILSGKKPSGERKPMLWVFPEYGGQVCVRIGDFKILRKNLQTKPSPWEVYNIANDRQEQHNIASKNPALIEEAKKILREQWVDNQIYPLDKTKALN